MSYETLVSTAILAQHLSDPNWVPFDCRFALDQPGHGEEAYRLGHIPGARYAHLDRDLAAERTRNSGRHPLPEPQKFARWLSRQGVARRSQVIAYDDSGGPFAARLWWMLRWLGHKSVAVLDGGWRHWVEQGLPVDTEVTPPKPADFPATPKDNLWLSTEQVETFLADGGGVLMDARAEPRFTGEVEPIDAVAGHVPGAINHPFQYNLEEGGLFKEPAMLKQSFEKRIGDTLATRTVHMCGSGVTACHNLLAMEVAGLAGSRLYPGSWSEWIVDSGRPVAKGE